MKCSVYHKVVTAVFACLSVLALGGIAAASDACSGEAPTPPANFQCPPGIPLSQGTFHATPLIDGDVNTHYPPPPYAGFHVETVTMYGQYGNDEQNSSFTEAQAHYTLGNTQAAAIRKLDTNGQQSPGGSIVVGFIGFSNCEIEICGGQVDAWHLALQPCATTCKNPLKIPPIGYQPWSTASEDQGTPQQSLMWQIYSPDNGGPHVGPHVYLFNGAIGKRALADWDPRSPDNRCDPDPECNYNVLRDNLISNGFSEKQMQVLFVYDANNFPNCDLGGTHCTNPFTQTPDAYKAERNLAEILRYLKQGLPDHQPPIPPRYPNLKQVFIMTRNYGGYSQNSASDPVQGCVSPEPFAYEQAFGIQRLIVAQIRQNAGLSSNDQYAGQVKFTNSADDTAPWFDWGPYLWASGNVPRSDGLLWCNNNDLQQCLNVFDFRNGDPNQGLYGDLTHPRHSGQAKAATKIFEWLTDTNNLLVTPWIGK